MLKDVTGIELVPGDEGRNCLGDGKHYDENGTLIECCCDECDYLMCCLKNACLYCGNKFNCPKEK